MDDGRLCGQERCFFRKKLTKMQFAPPTELDHAHCCFCWERFGLSEEMSKEGYKTTDDKRKACFVQNRT